MYPSPSKNSGGNRDLRKGALSPEEMADIIRQLEEAKMRERQRAAKRDPTKKRLFPNAVADESKPESYPAQDKNFGPGPPPPAPTKPTFMFFME